MQDKLMIYNTLKFSVILLLTFTSHLTYGNTLTESDFYGDLPVVLSVSRLEQNLVESPLSVTIIDREMIAASAAREIKDLLMLVPGFNVSNYNGNTPSVTYHGMSEQFSRRLQVLINGRPAYLPFFGGVFWSDLTIDIEDIEKIEVIRGPNAALYGSNSFSAIISITTRTSAKDNEPRVLTRIGENNIKDLYFNYSGLLNDAEYSMSVSKSEDNGFDGVSDSKESKRFTGYYSRQITPYDSLEIDAGFLSGPRGTGRGMSLLDVTRDKEVDAHFLRLKWNHENTHGDNFYIQFFSHTHTLSDEFVVDGDYDIPLLIPPFNITIPISFASNFDVKSERNDIEIQYTPHMEGSYRYVAGASIRRDKVTAPFLIDTRDSRELDQARLFGNIEYRINDKWLVNAGIMIENTDIVDTSYSPKASLIYKLKENQSLRFTVSRATRTPVLLEEFSLLEFTLENIPPPLPPTVMSVEGRSSGNLVEEEITSTEIGYQAYLNQNSTNFNIKLFHEDINDLISQVYIASTDSLDGELFDFQNKDDITIKGLELSLDQQLSGPSRFIAGFTFMEVKSNDFGNEFSLSVPKFSLFGMITHELSNYSNIGLTYNYRSTNSPLDSSLKDRFDKLDIKYTYILNPNSTFSIVIQNLHDNIPDHNHGNMSDTTFFTELKLTF